MYTQHIQIDIFKDLFCDMLVVTIIFHWKSKHNASGKRLRYLHNLEWILGAFWATKSITNRAGHQFGVKKNRRGATNS